MTTKCAPLNTLRQTLQKRFRKIRNMNAIPSGDVCPDTPESQEVHIRLFRQGVLRGIEVALQEIEKLEVNES